MPLGRARSRVPLAEASAHAALRFARSLSVISEQSIAALAHLTEIRTDNEPHQTNATLARPSVVRHYLFTANPQGSA
jgi:hypothetical protein